MTCWYAAQWGLMVERDLLLLDNGAVSDARVSLPSADTKEQLAIGPHEHYGVLVQFSDSNEQKYIHTKFWSGRRTLIPF